ncbi:MAG: alpha/beta fold hydrolase [Anaerolinea sp.]|nr:alpha/beta fold hydrolase [Anaerolinea sp.]
MRQVIPYFGYRRRVVRVRSLNLSCWDEGSGAPILLIHGLGGSLEYWAWVFPQLIERFRVIALDLPGFGESSPLPENLLNLPNAVELLHEFIEAVGLVNPLIVGHSLGGALVLTYASTYPDEIGGVMSLCPPGFGREIDLIARVLTLPGLGELLFQPTPNAIRGVINCPRTVPGVEHLIKLTYQRYQRTETRRQHLLMLRQGVNFVGQTLRFRREQFARLGRRVKVVWGDRDPVVPVRHAQNARRLLPAAELDILPAGHMILLEQPGLVGRLIAAFASAYDSG